MDILLSVVIESISKLVPVRQFVTAELPMPGICRLSSLQQCGADVMVSRLVVTLENG